MLGPAEAKEKTLKALSARRVVERGWLTALLGLYILKRKEAKVRLRYIGDVVLQRKDFGALARLTYHTTKCWPWLPEELARTAGNLLRPQDAIPWLLAGLSLARQACEARRLGKRISLIVSSERVSLEVNGALVAFRPFCISATLYDTFLEGEYEVPEALSGLRGRDVIDVGAGIGDSALYFILHGARKVIAVEPLPNVAKCAEENLRLNDVADKVKVVNAALGGEPMSVPCDQAVYSSGGFSTLKGSGPCKVPGVSLSDLLNMIDDPYLLKMDCEGCEAEAVLGPERERLRAFEHIIFETHPFITGVSDEELLASLKELGFECRLHIVHDPKLGVNIYHCKHMASQRQPAAP
ncbi:MAG: FkbM family methyltransferase [Acidilobus sp.]